MYEKLPTQGLEVVPCAQSRCQGIQKLMFKSSYQIFSFLLLKRKNLRRLNSFAILCINLAR